MPLGGEGDAGAAEATNPELVPFGARRALPWRGLGVALGTYALFVLVYVGLAHWRSPDYQAAVHVDEALELLGPNRGRSTPERELVEAYEHLLEAARLRPEVTAIHQELQALNVVAEERALSLPLELRNRAESVAAVHERMRQERAPVLVMGASHRGWHPQQLRAGPATALKWSVLGAVLIVVLWAYRALSVRRVVEEDAEARASELEAELAERERERSRR